MTDWQLYVGDVLVILGTLGTTLAVAAVLRFPDVAAKIQAAAAMPIIGVSLVLAAACLAGDVGTVGRAILVGVVLVVGGAVGAHALIELAHARRRDGTDRTRRQDLRGGPPRR